MIACQILSLFILVLLLATLVIKERGDRKIPLFITSIILAMLHIAFSVYKSTAYAAELKNDPQSCAAAIGPLVDLFVYLTESFSLAFFCLFLKRELFNGSRSADRLMTALSFFSAPLTLAAAFLPLRENAFAVIFLLQAVLIGLFIAFSPVERNVRVWLMIAGAIYALFCVVVIVRPDTQLDGVGCMLIGVSKATKDEPSFKIALYLILAGIAVAIVGGIFSSNTTVTSITSTIGEVVNLGVTVFIIQGIKNLAAKLGDEKMVKKGDTIFKYIIAIYVLVIIAQIVTMILQNGAALAVALAVIVISGILEIIQYILYLIYLSKAKKMLA